LPMSDVIRLGSHAHHYLAIFDKGKALALYHTNLLNSCRRSRSAAMISEAVTGAGSYHTCRLKWVDFRLACRPVTAAYAWSG
jgi:hypothetical protein